jgi:EmrB/QacA subfamily drug resistance transporter
VQGLGAALLVPTTLAIIMATFTDVKERTRAIGTWAAIGALALALGPLLGGLISQHVHWGWIFFINVPIGLITLAIAIPVMPESRDGAVVRRLDVPGLVSSAVALFALTYALIEGPYKGWTSGLIGASFAIAAAGIGAFLWIETRVRYPMVDVRLFRSRVFGGGTLVMMLWAFGIFGIYFFTSIYLQTMLGFSPTRAGLAFVPMAVVLAISASVAPQVVPRLGAHRTVGLGMAVMAVGLYLVARLGGGATFASLQPGFVLFGAGAGMMNVPLTNAVLHSMPPERSGIASAVFNASRELAGLLGITIIGAVLSSRERNALAHGATTTHAYLDGYHVGLLLTVTLLAVGAVAGYLALRKVSGDHAAPDVEATVAAELAAAPELAPAREDAPVAGR